MYMVIVENDDDDHPKALEEIRRSDSYCCPGPYKSKHRSSNAETIILDTCPKNAADTAACTGLAKENARSSVTNVGPSSRAPALASPGTEVDVVESGGLLLA